MLIKFAIKDFIADKKYKHLSNNTLGVYDLVLHMFQDYCSRNEIVSIHDVSAQTVKSFLIELQNEKGNNATSSNNKLRVLKNFYNWLQENEIIIEKQNVCKKVNYAKEDIVIQPFSDHHIEQMLGYLRRIKQRECTYYAIRDYTIIVFLLGTGVRLGELVNLKWSDIDLKHGSATILGKKRELSSVPLTDKLSKEIAEFKVYCEQHFGIIGEYVFSTDKNTQLQSESLKTIFKRLKKVMNFKDVRLSCHTFRSTFAVRCIQNGMDAFTLQRLLRHSDIAMTNRYVRMFGTALKSQNDKFNPLNSIRI
ncbi:tyrosine-type recombinase/integrase [Brevibacillus choshinensis]|uniref:tyrosine-type recombinase/integrase n=1 Tax=Brevibacillus choshinensis TaxID=54911 RepID=UPI002E1DA002|nr:tyrosine-type recombinase/integrase [Brevibacillus choshinensis]MED4780936.1 tyrosine-type recombinase/integrase [Brevibacillus choshinensis]